MNSMKSLIKLKSIKKLKLNDMNRFVETDLILLVKELPLLQDISIQTSCSESITMAVTMDGLIEMVQSGKRLRSIDLGCTENLNIDRNDFDTLLNAVKSDDPNRKLSMSIKSSPKQGRAYCHEQLIFLQY